MKKSGTMFAAKTKEEHANIAKVMLLLLSWVPMPSQVKRLPILGLECALSCSLTI
jgi:hypothetical protein